jgi:enolase-phosphatase E1
MISCILTDIEGTTSSIEFVHKVLFPYSRANFFRFLSESTDSDVSKIVEEIWLEDLGQTKGSKPDLARVTELLQKWIDEDLKKNSLKVLQGKIWKEGFEAKAYFGHVYPEVKTELENWKKAGLRLAVYSSGSVQAQKLLFQHSEAGDLTPFFSANFDTAVGHKREAKSYLNIAKDLELDPESILFLSDIKEELDAAEQAGMQTCQLMRAPAPAQGHHQTARDFKEVTRAFLTP